MALSAAARRQAGPALQSPHRGLRFIHRAHAARLGLEHFLRALDGDPGRVDLHLRLEDAAIRGGL
jgi:hypothetical protein